MDMGCVGNGLMCTEREVSICAKDSGGPYNYEIVSRLVELAKENNIGFAVDVYPHYGSDVEILSVQEMTSSCPDRTRCVCFPWL